jgi:hypothetical protein
MKIIETGILNPGGEGRRAVASRPSVVLLDDGTLLAAYRVGSTKDADDETVELRSSTDLGRTWGEPYSPFSATVGGVRGSLPLVYLTRLDGGRLLAVGMWVNREAFPGKPLFNAETEGCLPMGILVADSSDRGRTWSAWRVVAIPADIGPPSLTSPILRFADGSLAISIETNKNYLDRSAWRQRVVYFRSFDQGRTWSPPEAVSEDPTQRIFYWDQRAAVAPDGRLVTFSWTYDRHKSAYVNIERNLSLDRGKSWRGFVDLGFSDQPSRPAILADGRVVVAWVDRFGSSSIRARLAAGLDAPFPAATEVVLYEHGKQAASSLGTGELLADMGQWSYGLPYAEALPPGDVLVTYYAGTDRRMSIHWARLAP